MYDIMVHMSGMFVVFSFVDGVDVSTMSAILLALINAERQLAAAAMLAHMPLSTVQQVCTTKQSPLCQWPMWHVACIMRCSTHANTHHACVRACWMGGCVRACVRACARACMHVCVVCAIGRMKAWAVCLALCALRCVPCAVWLDRRLLQVLANSDGVLNALLIDYDLLGALTTERRSSTNTLSTTASLAELVSNIMPQFEFMCQPDLRMSMWELGGPRAMWELRQQPPSCSDSAIDSRYLLQHGRPLEACCVWANTAIGTQDTILELKRIVADVAFSVDTYKHLGGGCLFFLWMCGHPQFETLQVARPWACAVE